MTETNDRAADSRDAESEGLPAEVNRDGAAVEAPVRRRETTDAAIASALEGSKRQSPRLPSGEHGQARIGIYASNLGGPNSVASVGRQIRFCADYADRRWQESVATFADTRNTCRDATSTGRRLGLSRLLDACDRGEIQLVVVEDPTRFAPNLGVLGELMQRFAAAGVVVHCAVDGHEIDGAASLLAGMRAIDDRHRRRAISLAARRRLVSRGGIPHAAPFGYRAGAVRGFPEVDPFEAAVVARVFDMAGQGQTCLDIATALAGEDVPGPSGPGRWSGDTVRRILGQALYSGRIVIKDDEPVAEVRPAGARSRRVRKKASAYVPAERYRIVDDVRFFRAARRRTKRSK